MAGCRLHWRYQAELYKKSGAALPGNFEFEKRYQMVVDALGSGVQKGSGGKRDYGPRHPSDLYIEVGIRFNKKKYCKTLTRWAVWDIQSRSLIGFGPGNSKDLVRHRSGATTPSCGHATSPLHATVSTHYDYTRQIFFLRCLKFKTWSMVNWTCQI